MNPFRNWTQADAAAHNARVTKRPAPERDEAEAAIHAEVIRQCRLNGWYYVHSRMDRKATTAPGTPDFLILMPGGRPLAIECKRPKAKLTPEQRATGRWLLKLGVPFMTIRSVTEARELLASAYVFSLHD